MRLSTNLYGGWKELLYPGVNKLLQGRAHKLTEDQWDEIIHYARNDDYTNVVHILTTLERQYDAETPH